MSKKLWNQKGQTLIEAVGALGILAIVISATTIAVTTSLSNATYDKNQTLATQYAQQGTEIVRQTRDDNYPSFQGYSGTYCLVKGQTALSAGPCSANIDGFFVRSVQITPNGCGQNVSQVIVSVAFQDGKCPAGNYCHSQTDTSCLSVVNPVAAP